MGDTVKRSAIWWIPLLQGMAAIFLGALLLTDFGAPLVGSIVFLGIYWLILGVLALVQTFVDDSIAWIWSLLIGISGIIAGIFVLNHPLLVILTEPNLVVSLGVMGLTIGALETIGGWTGAGVAPLILGVSNALIGFLLLDPSVLAALEASLAFSVILLIQGATLLILGFRSRTVRR